MAAGMIYGGGILMPLVLGLIMKGFGSSTSISMVITGFGYSYSVFIPVTFLCTIPYFVSGNDFSWFNLCFSLMQGL